MCSRMLSSLLSSLSQTFVSSLPSLLIVSASAIVRSSEKHPTINVCKQLLFPSTCTFSFRIFTFNLASFYISSSFACLLVFMLCPVAPRRDRSTTTAFPSQIGRAYYRTSMAKYVEQWEFLDRKWFRDLQLFKHYVELSVSRFPNYFLSSIFFNNATFLRDLLAALFTLL